MKYKVELDIPSNKVALFLEFLRSMSFVKKIKVIEENEITNPDILKSIEDYENKKVDPTPLNLEELKTLINA
ncbi:MAG: hypothetical protein ACK48V_10070 [Crocinitomicaceae bacterium]|jgi:hypothetical protein